MNDEVGTCGWLVAELTTGRVLERGQIEPLVNSFLEEHPYADANALAEHLVGQGLLTPFQAEKALVGEARTLVLGAYKLTDAIGVGSMGTVYRALGRADNQNYAVKVLPLRSQWNVRLARKQVRAFADLPSHPAVVRFLDVGTAGVLHYLVWPLAQGETLEHRIKRVGPLSPAMTSKMSAQIAEALHLCHTHGLFHGMLKPSNLMLGPDGQVRILDFGIGALLTENAEESLVDTMSTAQAMAGILDCTSPETFLDPASRSPAGDQYSLGCTMYFALTGRYPFPEGNAVEKMLAHQTAQPTPLRSINPAIPVELVGIIERLMAKTPDRRFPNMAALAAALKPPSAAPVPSSAPAQAGGPTPPPTPKPAFRPLPSPTPTPTDQTPTPPRSPAGPVEPPRVSSPLLPPTPAPLAAPTPPRGSTPSLPSMPSLPTMPSVPAPAPPAPKPAAARTPASLPAVRESLPPPTPTAPPTIARPTPAPKPSFVQRVLSWFQRGQGAATRMVQCTLFAPRQIRPGESATVQIFIHDAEAALSVAALAQSFAPNLMPLAAAALAHEPPATVPVMMHLAVTGLSVPQPLQSITWHGQPGAVAFTVQVPTNCSAGAVGGVMSVGQNNVLIGRLEFRLAIAH